MKAYIVIASKNQWFPEESNWHRFPAHHHLSRTLKDAKAWVEMMLPVYKVENNEDRYRKFGTLRAKDFRSTDENVRLEVEIWENEL